MLQLQIGSRLWITIAGDGNRYCIEVIIYTHNINSYRCVSKIGEIYRLDYDDSGLKYEGNYVVDTLPSTRLKTYVIPLIEDAYLIK